jgi:hypothetical protein
MASRLYRNFSRKQLIAGGAVLGISGIAAGNIRRHPLRLDTTYSPAEEQFHTSSQYPVPSGYSGPTWKIQNDYPQSMGLKGLPPDKKDVTDWPTLPGPSRPPPSFDLKTEAPWLRKDFRTQPYEYCALIKAYCWEGNVNNGFRVENNKV